MPNVPSPKIITCLIPHHKSLEILEHLSSDKGIIMANKSNARGSSYATDFTWVEMEILDVIVEASRADEIFAYLYNLAEVNTPQGGLIYQHKLTKASQYQLPQLSNT